MYHYEDPPELTPDQARYIQLNERAILRPTLVAAERIALWRRFSAASTPAPIAPETCREYVVQFAQERKT